MLRRTVIGVILASTATACSPEPEASLVAVLGCGLDLEGEFSELRVTVRGDFQPSADDQLSLDPDEVAVLPSPREGARGLTVEGLVGSYAAAVGRTLSLEGERLPVYFAPPDSLCSVPSTVEPRQPGAIAVGDDGRVLLVGGRRHDGSMVDELVEIDARTGAAQVLDEVLPAPTAGQSLHALGGGRFVMVGGAHVGAVWHSGLEIDLDATPVLADQATHLLVDGAVHGVALHAAVRLPDGRDWLIGGCRSIDAQGRCAATEDGPTEVLDETFIIEPGDLQTGESAPSLLARRWGAFATVAADGVVYVVGGFDELGAPVTSVERAHVGAEAWTAVVDPEQPVTGAAILDGGLLVLSLADGSLAWWSEDSGGGVLAADSVAPPLEAVDPSTSTRPLQALLDERLLVDAFAFLPGSTDPIGAGVVDLSESTPGASPGQRRGAAMVVLADGTVLFAGGVEEDAEGEFAPAQPFLLRMRGPLDGPDEEMPDVALPATTAFVTNAPGACTAGGGELVFTPPAGESPAGADLPTVRAHVRGFRSRALRLDLRVAARSGEARAFAQLEVGARWMVAVGLDSPTATVVRRAADGSLAPLDCAVKSSPPELGENIELVLAADGLSLSAAGGEFVRCSAEVLDLPEGAPAIGLGAQGEGELRFDRLRLSRLE